MTAIIARVSERAAALDERWGTETIEGLLPDHEWRLVMKMVRQRVKVARSLSDETEHATQLEALLRGYDAIEKRLEETGREPGQAG